jgi:hypothetical protein
MERRVRVSPVASQRCSRAARGVRPGALWAALVCSAACHVARAPSATLAPASIAVEVAKERGERRFENFRTRLHPLARALVRGQAGEAAWLRDGLLALPTASCAAAIQWSPPATLECSLVALDAGATAVLVMREAGACRDVLCVEHSWVFLNGCARPLPLPAPRAAEYRRLRAELSKEDATALWLAGFRGAGDGRLAEAAEGDEPALAAALDPPPLSTYQSCTLAPDQRELVCRATSGDVIGIHPLRGARRLIARLGLELASAHDAHAPVDFTRDGKLLLRARAREPALCGLRPCELLARIAWPTVTPAQAEWVRAERAAFD